MSNATVKNICTISDYSMMRRDQKAYKKQRYPCSCPKQTKHVLSCINHMAEDAAQTAKCKCQGSSSSSDGFDLELNIKYPPEGCQSEWKPDEIFQITQCYPYMNDGTKQSESLIAPTSCKSEFSVKSEVVTTPECDIKDLLEQLRLPIDPEVVKDICFAENLLISSFNNVASCFGGGGESCDQFPSCAESLDGTVAESVTRQDLELLKDEQVGGMCISVSETDGNLVCYVTSNYSQYGKGAVSELLAVLDKNFYLVQEKNMEQVNGEEYHLEKTLQIIAEQERNKFTALQTEKVNTHKEFGKRGHIWVQAGGNLMPNGGHFILMRYLVLIDYVGCISTWSMNIDGELCQSVVDVTEKFAKLVNGVCTKVKQIVRTLYCADHTRQTSISYYLMTGHLVRHTWENCDFYIHMNPMADIPPNFYKMDLAERWEKDVELFSLYLDFKEKRRQEIRENLRNQPEVKCLIKDYVLNMMQNKPRDVLDHTVKYFLNLAQTNFQSQ